MNLGYDIYEGVFSPNFELSALERRLFNEFEALLVAKGFRYLGVPTSTEARTLYNQNAATDQMAYWLDGHHCLNGSAEQGILEHFVGKTVDTLNPTRVYAFTHCFRREFELLGLVRLKEFKKIEQFVLCDPRRWEDEFELVLTNATNFLSGYGIEHRIVDVTDRDSGYHVKKLDIEVNTRSYGWIESHSCTYFGEQQAYRMGIGGDIVTISNTGLASPRILIPFIERECELAGRIELP